MKNNPVAELKKTVAEIKNSFNEINSLSDSLKKTYNNEEKEMISSQISSLMNSLKAANEKLPEVIGKISINRQLKQQPKENTANVAGMSNLNSRNRKEITDPTTKPVKGPIASRLIQRFSDSDEESSPGQTPLKGTPQTQKQIPEKSVSKKVLKKKNVISEFEKETVKRLKKRKKKVQQQKIKKPSRYVKTASVFFSKISNKLVKKKMFESMKKDLVRAELQFVPTNYISVILLTTLLSVFVGVGLFAFFLFFSISANLPIIVPAGEDLMLRLLKTFWIPLVVPIGTFLFMYFYPSLEKKSIESKMNLELPFATINMSAISGSMIEPSKIFNIILMTKEYPSLEKKFTKLMNEINVYGYDLATALRSMAENSPGSRVSELFNGIATTILSGGNLPEFFSKRSQTLMFEHKLEREKQTRAAETFMDIYISVVIAAPMILMILLMMMKIGGFGISLSAGMITTIIILSIVAVNIFFLAFLQLKQPNV